MKSKILKVVLKVLSTIIILSFIIFLILYNIYTFKKINNSLIDINNDLSNYTYEKMEINANTLDDINSQKEKGKPLIVVFSSEGCHYCNDYMPAIKELYRKYKNVITIKYIDTSKNEDILNPYNITSIPTTIFFGTDGNAYKPSENIVIESAKANENNDENNTLDETEEMKLVTGNDLGLNNTFKYGQDQQGNILYTSYTGVIKMTELEIIVKELLSNES